MASAGKPSFSSVLASTSHMRFVEVKMSVLSVGLFWQRRSRPMSSRFLASSSQRITCCVMFGLIVRPFWFSTSVSPGVKPTVPFQALRVDSHCTDNLGLSTRVLKPVVARPCAAPVMDGAVDGCCASTSACVGWAASVLSAVGAWLSVSAVVGDAAPEPADGSDDETPAPADASDDEMPLDDAADEVEEEDDAGEVDEC